MEPGDLAAAVVDELIPYLRGDERSWPLQSLQSELWSLVRLRLTAQTSNNLVDGVPTASAARVNAYRALNELFAEDQKLARRAQFLINDLAFQREVEGGAALSHPPQAPPDSEWMPTSSGPVHLRPEAPAEDANDPDARDSTGERYENERYENQYGQQPPAGPEAHEQPAYRQPPYGQPSGPWPQANSEYRGARSARGRGGRWLRNPGGLLRMSRRRYLARLEGNGQTRAKTRRTRSSGARELRRDGEGTPSRQVSTGVATLPPRPRILSARTVLGTGRDYLYWLGIGDLPGRVDTGTGQSLPMSYASPGTRLTVIVSPFSDGLVIDPDRDTGELEFGSDGSLAVVRQPDAERMIRLDDSRLWFPIRTPEQAGTYHLRSSIYLGARLLQSRMLEVRVTRRQHPARRLAMESRTDYNISESLDRSLVDEMRPPKVSIMVNEGPTGSHDFRFVGTVDGHAGALLHETASLDAGLVTDMLDRARNALRRVAWDNPAEWTDDDTYRYEQPRSPDEVMADLTSLAIAGWRIWTTLKSALAHGVSGQGLPTVGRGTTAEGIAALLRVPGSVELACRENLRLAVPTALVYDYPLDTGLDLRFCPEAERAVFSGTGNLSIEPCFLGSCPHREVLNVVCPGGFWGYRHDLGVPISLTGGSGHAGDVTPTIRGADSPVFVVGTTTDSKFTRRLDHLGRLERLHVPIDWRVGTERQAVLGMLKAARPHVVYFLCHGIEKNGLPGLIVGDPNTVAITPDNLDSYEIGWPETRPLVILNGCRTTALDPTKPHNFVEKFVRDSFASGVLGTEITVFEPLACDFAEEVLHRFIRDDLPLGRAVRESRLALLRRRNPLGLAYVPYAPVELHMA